jgi:hypothetical protein
VPDRAIAVPESEPVAVSALVSPIEKASVALTESDELTLAEMEPVSTPDSESVAVTATVAATSLPLAESDELTTIAIEVASVKLPVSELLREIRLTDSAPLDISVEVVADV